MKKLIIMTAILVGLSVSAQAHEFEVSGKGISMTGYNFSGEKDILNMDNGTLTLDIQNDTSSEIIATYPQVRAHRDNGRTLHS